ncbi:UNVERIFIED_CONTAM: hypothetical protein NCL1_24331 [Trichonephila clavipes]
MRSMQYMKPDTIRILKIITCAKRAWRKTKIGANGHNYTFIVENNRIFHCSIVRPRFFAARSLILLSSSSAVGQHSDCCSYHFIAVFNVENASVFDGPFLRSLLLLSSSSYV